MQNTQGIISKKGKVKIGGSFSSRGNTISSTATSSNVQGIVSGDEVSVGSFSSLNNKIGSVVGSENIQGIEAESDIEARETFQSERNEITVKEKETNSKKSESTTQQITNYTIVNVEQGHALIGNQIGNETNLSYIQQKKTALEAKIETFPKI